MRSLRVVTEVLPDKLCASKRKIIPHVDCGNSLSSSLIHPRTPAASSVLAEAADARRPTLSGMSIRDPGPGGDAAAQVPARARADFRLLAERLARDLSGHVVRFRPGLSLDPPVDILCRC